MASIERIAPRHGGIIDQQGSIAFLSGSLAKFTGAGIDGFSGNGV